MTEVSQILKFESYLFTNKAIQVFNTYVCSFYFGNVAWDNSYGKTSILPSTTLNSNGFLKFCE